jgi:hypothetical protein
MAVPPEILPHLSPLRAIGGVVPVLLVPGVVVGKPVYVFG